jgi:hypothetical protein
MSPRARYLVWRIRDALGLEGLAGVILLVVAAGGGALGWSATQQASVQRATLERLRAAPAVPSVGSVVHEPSIDAELPRRSQVPAVLADLARLAAIARIDASNARYEYLPGTPSVPAQLEIRLELQARYGTLRSFVVMVSNSLPAVVLRDFTAKRLAPDTDDLRAELRFVVVLAQETR